MEEAERELTRATEMHERVFGNDNELTAEVKRWAIKLQVA